jgi:N-acetylglucosaminyl-diphospho-decaprenol L-rhamnosyltransferase
VGLSLIVVHYRSREPLRHLLDSLREVRPEPLREILVVNNSGEPLEDLLAGLPWPIRVLVPGKNVGYARGVNAGLRAAQEADALILNPDVRVTPGAVEALVRCAEGRPRAGIVAPQLLNEDGTLQLSARRSYTWKTLLLRRAPLGPFKSRSRTLRDHVMADWDHADTRPVDWVLGAAMYVRRRAVRDVGVMDERYFLYFEDVDWCQRMWRHGYEVIYCAESRMVHTHARRSAELDPRSLRAHAAGLLRFTEKWSALMYAVSQGRRRLLAILALGVDVVVTLGAFLLAYSVRVALDPVFEKPMYPLAGYAPLAFFTVAVTVAALAANGLYRRAAYADGIERAVRVGQAVLQAGLLLMATTFLFQTPRYSRVLVLLLGPLLYGGLIAARAAVEWAGAGARRQGFAFRRVLVLGAGAEAERTRSSFEAARGEGFEPIRAAAPADPAEAPEEAAARIRTLVEAERVHVVCIAPESAELPYLLALGSALRDSGAAVYCAGSLAHLLPEGSAQRLGPVPAVLLHAPSRGLSLRARKRAADLLLSFLVAPWRWRGLGAYLARRGDRIGPGEAWRQVWSGERSWVGRSAYETDRWAGVPDWARLALESLRPGVVTPANGASSDRADRMTSELAYLTRFSFAEDLRIFLRVTAGGAR